MPLVLPFPEIDPALFTIELFGLSFSLRWYALAYLGGLILAWRLTVRLMRRPELWPAGRAPMTTEQPEQLLTWMVLGVVLGGRLGFVLFYQPAYYLANPAEILQVWQGGMSFHGGFIGVILGVIGYARLNNLPLLQIGDVVALVTPPGLFFGRMANFINGELWGRPTDAPWAMMFPTVPEAFWVNGVNVPRHPSQIYEAVLEGALLFLVMWWLATRKEWFKRPGMLIGLFFIGYGAARTLVENFRQADPQYITATNPSGHVVQFFADYGLTMGQLLSLPMILVGLAFWAIARRA